MLKIAGNVLFVKMSSLKHNVPCNRFVVFETYREKPKSAVAKSLKDP